MSPRWMTAVLALSAAFAGVIGLVLLLAGASTYGDIARAEGFEKIPFHVPSTVPVAQRRAVLYDLATRNALHASTLAFVLSEDPSTPLDPTTREPLFDADERQHLADVRSVFTGVRIGAFVALAAALATLGAAARSGWAAVLILVRDAAIVGTGVVTLIAVVFAVAFEPAFLAFHYVFFPQGNFLFDPATSDLLALYPEQYWYSVTLRIGGTFILAMVGIAIVATLLIRRGALR